MIPFYRKYPEKANPRQEAEWWLPWSGGVTANGYEVSFLNSGNVLKLDWDAAQLYTLTKKNHKIVNLKLSEFGGM